MIIYTLHCTTNTNPNMTRPFWHLSLPAAADSERCGEPRMPAVNGLDVELTSYGVIYEHSRIIKFGC